MLKLSLDGSSTLLGLGMCVLTSVSGCVDCFIRLPLTASLIAPSFSSRLVFLSNT